MYSDDASIGDSNAEKPIAWKLWFGNYNETEKKVIGKFGVTMGGYLWAQDAHIEGTITAEKGRIGNWSIDGSSLTAISYEDETKNNGNIAFLSADGRIDDADLTDNTDPYTIFVGEKEDGEWAGSFGVTKNGILFAKGAKIDGNITATEGRIANWLIDGSSLTSIEYDNNTAKKNGNIAFISADGRIDDSNLSSNADPYKIFIGEKEDGKWKGTFGVTKNGLMFATGATLDGNITAREGQIARWTFSETANGSSFNTGLYHRFLVETE